MRKKWGLVLVCIGLVLFICPAAEAKDESGAKTVIVDCEKGDSINEALEEKADELVIEIVGTCQEDVVIERNNVTLRGAGSGATVVAASSTAIYLDRVSRVSLENLSAQGGIEGPGDIGGAGVAVVLSTGVSVSDLVVELGQSKGMIVAGSEVIISDSDFRDNNGYGLQGNASKLFFLGGEVELSGNSYEGLLLSFQSSLISVASVRANGNGDGGIMLGENSSASLIGPVEVTGNDVAGIGAESGSVLGLSDVEAYGNENGLVAMTGGQIHIAEDGGAYVHDNTLTGLTAVDDGFFEFTGTVESNGTFGVYLDAGSATFRNSTILGNTWLDVYGRCGNKIVLIGGEVPWGTIVILPHGGDICGRPL